jgi:hypothetical protein
MSRSLRAAIALAVPAFLVVLGLTRPRLVLEGVVLPAATAVWLVLRIFVLGIDQEVYWWGAIVLTFIVAIVLGLRGSARSVVHSGTGPAPVWDPALRWRESILLNVHGAAQRDTFRREMAWLLASQYASRHPGFARYQVHAALQEGRIPIPPAVHEFLFSSVKSQEAAPSFLAHPVVRLRTAWTLLSQSLRAGSRRRRFTRYVRSAQEALAFIEEQMEMTHELESDA